MKCVLPTALALLVTSAVAFAEDSAARAVRDKPGRGLRDEVFEMVDAYLLMKVQERLDLTDEQLVRFMPLIRKHQLERREMEHRRFRLLMEMRDMFASGSAKEERIAALLRDLKTVEAELPVSARRNMDAIDVVLTPVQQAKYRLLEVEIDRRLRELRHSAHERRGLGRMPADGEPPQGEAGPRPPRHAPPAP
jgi:Spy/CpxP family protein refolding chaperone